MKAERNASRYLGDPDAVEVGVLPFSGTASEPPMPVAQAHKRLMLLGTISLLDAAVARWFPMFLAPPGPPPVVVTIPPALVAYLLLAVAVVFDWRTRGRPHPVYVFGGAALVALQVLNLPLSATPFWHSLAGGILALAQ